MSYTFRDTKLKLSPRAESVMESVKQRLKCRAYREGTITGIVHDGKTPFLDVFEEMVDTHPYCIVLATAIARSWLVCDPEIHPGELIVGENRPIRRFIEHFSWGISDYGWVCKMTDFADNHGDYSKYEEIAEDVDRRAKRIWDKMFIDNGEAAEREERRIFGGAEPGALWGTGGYQGHTVPGYPKLLRLGLDRTLEEIDKYDANTNDEKKHELYEAMRIIVRGLSDFAEGYACKAYEMATSAADSAERERLLNIAANCRAVAHRAPENYYEAAQLTWFYSLWDWVDSLGRMDCYLYPYYLMTDERAFSEEITIDLVMKIWEHGAHNVTLGGADPATGICSVNELTYLILQITRRIHSTHPRLTLRVGKDTPDEVLLLAATMWSEGMSDPTLASDTLIIDGLRRYGVTLEDARDYTLLGCQEIEIPGKSNFGCEDGSFNLAKVLEYTLNDGKCADSASDVRVVPYGKTLTDYSSVEEIWEDFAANVRHLTGPFCRLCDMGQQVRDVKLAKLVKSVYTDDCIARGVNLDGGGATYNYGVCETAGLAVTADSFAALETLVFGDSSVSAEELKAAMKAEFKGYDALRQRLLDAPKFGNDDDRADIWACRILEMFWTELGRYKSIRGGAYLGACSLLTGGVMYGYGTAALPDGHRCGDPLGNTMGPRPGADKSGITSMLKSVSKLPLHLGLGGTTLNALVPCSENVTDENKMKIVSLFRTFLENGGQLVQITTASKEAMIEAQRDPENHSDLIVRVGGYSCPFVDLSRSEQNEIISRYS